MISSFAASEGGGIGGIIDSDYMQLTSTTTRQVMCNKISNWFNVWRKSFSDKVGGYFFHSDYCKLLRSVQCDCSFVMAVETSGQ